MKTMLVLSLVPWSFLVGGVFGSGAWIVRRVRLARRERTAREQLRRRLNRQIDHPSTWNGDSAA